MVIAVGLVSAGCGAKRGIIPPTGPVQQVSLGALSARLDERAARIDGLKALVTLSAGGPSIQASLVYRRPDPASPRSAGGSVQLRGFDRFGRTAFDFSDAAVGFEVRFPGSDPVRLLPDDPIPLGPAADEIRPRDLLRVIQAVAGPYRTGGEGFVIEEEGRYYILHVVESDGSEARLVRRYWVDRVALEIAKAEFFDPGGRRKAVVEMGDFRFIKAASGEGGVVMPRHMVIHRPTGDGAIEIRILELNLNPAESGREVSLSGGGP